LWDRGMNSRQKCAWKSQTRLHTPQECQGRCQWRGISGLAFPVEGGRIHAKRTDTEKVQKMHDCTYLPLFRRVPQPPGCHCILHLLSSSLSWSSQKTEFSIGLVVVDFLSCRT